MLQSDVLILVVDDDPTQRMLCRESLEQRRYRVEEADCGETGLDLARQLRPDLILLDVMMPGMDGFEVCRAIRADESLHRTPVVIVTALEDLESIEIGFQAGATDFIAKPIVWPLLGYRLQFALRAAEMELDLIQARDEAELASRAKSMILANMGHELRTPLNAIIGFSGFLKDRADGDESSSQNNEFLEDIHCSGQQLLSTINDVLEMANLEAGRVELEESDIDLSRLFDNVIEKYHSAAAEKSVTLDARGTTNAPRIRGDYDRLKRVIGNLVLNAIKFTERGGVYISALLQTGGGVEISITDSGIGMSPEEILAIIEPFQQADSSLSRRTDGSGLGVPIARALLQLHDGGLDIKSEPNVGTTATLVLPPERVLNR